MRQAPLFGILALAALAMTGFMAGCQTAAAAEREPNLLANPGFEKSGSGGMPADWEKVVIGATPAYSIDQGDRHGGRQSMRITASEITRAYVESAPIPVAPGEKIRASAYVKVQDIPQKVGAVILIGHFMRHDGGNDQVEKFQVAKIPTATQPIRGWQRIEGTIKVPDDVDQMRVRAGLSYTKGTCWWDDLSVTAQPVVARIAMPGNELVPAMNPLPVTVLNRTHERAAARLEVRLGEKQYSKPFELNGEPVQTVPVPVEFTKRGKIEVEIALTRPRQPTEAFSYKTEVKIPRPIELDPPIPTHWAIEDGPAKISGDLWTALKPQFASGAKLTVSLMAQSGQTLASWSSQEIHRHETFELSGPVLAEGTYQVIASVQPSVGKAIRASQPLVVIPRRLAKVTIDDQGWCVYDGKEILPLGIFNGGPPKELAEAGFTITHSYNAVSVKPHERPDDQSAKAFLDATERAGMKACMMVPLKFAQDGEWDAFRRRIRMFRNHPGLLCWDEEEGLARGDWTMATLEKVRQILKEEDPNHPFMVGDARDVVYRVKDRSNFFPLNEMDMGMWWWYPLPMSAKPHIDPLEGVEVSGLQLTPPSFLTLARTNKPIWVGVQAYNKGLKAKRENGKYMEVEKEDAKGMRFPTPTEYRAQAYIALAEGAKGLMWYGGYVTGGVLRPWNKEAGHWNYLKSLASELHSLQDVLMGKTLEKPSVEPAKAPVSVELKRSAKRLVLIVVNRGPDAVELKLSSREIKAGPVQVIHEKRTVTAQGGSLSDAFGPYATHVYELTP